MSYMENLEKSQNELSHVCISHQIGAQPAVVAEAQAAVAATAALLQDSLPSSTGRPADHSRNVCCTK